MNVAEVLAAQRWVRDEPAAVQGHLIVTDLFSYLAGGELDTQGVLLHEPRLVPRLLQRTPVMVGSLVWFSGPATAEGLLSMPTGLPMFPAVLYSLKALVFRQEDRDPVRLEFS
jgi:hypothetical protein